MKLEQNKNVQHTYYYIYYLNTKHVQFLNIQNGYVFFIYIFETKYYAYVGLSYNVLSMEQ